MEELVAPLMRRVRAHRDARRTSSEPEEDALVMALFRLLYTLCKVRGHKTVGTSVTLLLLMSLLCFSRSRSCNVH
jgi:hypothetical protein